jgi:hypothetical protein
MKAVGNIRVPKEEHARGGIRKPPYSRKIGREAQQSKGPHPVGDDNLTAAELAREAQQAKAPLPIADDNLTAADAMALTALGFDYCAYSPAQARQILGRRGR